MLVNRKLIIGFIIIFVILFVISYYPSKDVYIENFMSPIPADYNYKLFVGDGKYFLFNNHYMVDYQKNPIIFDSYDKYLEYHYKNLADKFPPLKPRENRNQLYGRDKLPILPYQWMCKRKYAEAIAKYRDCSDKSYNIYNKETCKQFLEDNPKDDVFTNYNEEICMVKSLHRDYPELFNKNKVKKVSFNDKPIIIR